ncbi:hypothetical protein SAMN04489729_0073 [Amycolatopsis lurida]|nr:hypothetical protein SAMN04489729_0073 [Amycolatopsis lurida]
MIGRTTRVSGWTTRVIPRTAHVFRRTTRRATLASRVSSSQARETAVKASLRDQESLKEAFTDPTAAYVVAGGDQVSRGSVCTKLPSR